MMMRSARSFYLAILFNYLFLSQILLQDIPPDPDHLSDLINGARFPGEYSGLKRPGYRGSGTIVPQQ